MCNSLLKDLEEETKLGYWSIVFHVSTVKSELL